MADDPNKRGPQDRANVSWQQHEIDYVKRVVKSEFPTKSDAAITTAIDTCKKRIQPSEGREKLMACVRAALR